MSVLADQSTVDTEIKPIKVKDHREQANELYQHLPRPLQRAVDLAKEPDALTRLTARPVKVHGFALHKRVHLETQLHCGMAWSPSTCQLIVSVARPSMPHMLCRVPGRA